MSPSLRCDLGPFEDGKSEVASRERKPRDRPTRPACHGEREGSRGLRTFTIPRNYCRTRTYGATKNLSNNCRSTIHGEASEPEVCLIELEFDPLMLLATVTGRRNILMHCIM
jgi:hypothetical protein